MLPEPIPNSPLHTTLRILLSRLLLCMLVSSCLLGQTDTSALKGRVTDAQGGAVTGAQILLTNQATRGKKNSFRRHRRPIFSSLIPPGRYDIEAAAPGFKTFHDAGFQIDVAAPALSTSSSKSARFPRASRSRA